ncbi:MAG TPA: Crp/Fnr family transcriptional regulator [Candidatus Halomonas stercoripullorum]|uniref:Crp/Fnr family transcriptional regulator n=1 Tax=Candidatus Halomonas stercoripullorum TaxID=2838617 RepID=A0A9D1WNV7_9GAMM|nr:Crp/Fnr family transcriptional regulator [Candidatus Halomonas stercoripullorum]
MTLLDTVVFRALARQAALTADDKALLLGLELNPKRVTSGEVLWQERTPVDAFYVVKEGWVCSYRNMGNGTAQILKFYLPGDIVGLRDFGFSQRLASVSMINDGVISSFTYRQLFELFGHSRSLAVGITAMAARQQAMLSERLVYMGRCDAHERLAHFLYELYLRLDRIGAVTDGEFTLPLSQEQIGDALGLSSVHVSRTFSMLRDQGLVQRERQHVRLPDPEGLARLAEFNNTYLDESLSAAFQSFA